MRDFRLESKLSRQWANLARLQRESVVVPDGCGEIAVFDVLPLRNTGTKYRIYDGAEHKTIWFR
jgi:hypothetical protein